MCLDIPQPWMEIIHLAADIYIIHYHKHKSSVYVGDCTVLPSQPSSFPSRNPGSQILVRVSYLLSELGRNHLTIRRLPRLTRRIRIVRLLRLVIAVNISDLPDIPAAVLVHDLAPLALFAAVTVGAATAAATPRR